MRAEFKLLLALVIVILGQQETRASQQPHCNVVYELQDRIYAYDWNEDLWLPFTADSLSSNLLGFSLSLQIYRSLDLELTLPQQTAIYIDDKMVGYKWDDSNEFWDLDSLADIYSQEEVFISFYNRQGLSPKVILINLCSDFEWIEDDAAAILVLERERSAFSDFFIVAFFLVIAYFVVSFKRFPDFFREFFSFRTMYSLRIKKEENLLTGRPINPINLFFMVGYSLMLSFLIIAVSYLYYLEELTFISFHFSFLTYIAQWLGLSFLLLILLHLKYFYIWFLSNLFDLGKFRNSHFIDYIGMANIFFAGLFFLLGFTYFGWRFAVANVIDVALIFIVLFLVLRILILFFKSLSVSTFQKLHLFSYLCTSELVPALIIIKIIGI